MQGRGRMRGKDNDKKFYLMIINYHILYTKRNGHSKS